MDSRTGFGVGSIASREWLNIAAIPKLMGGVIFLSILYHVSIAIYNIYFHPLRKFPGPKLFAASRIPYAIALSQGKILQVVNDAHERYGEVVRVAPNELSFIAGETAWQEIYGFRGGKKEEFGKDLQYFPKAVNGVRSILSANRQDHSRVRRVFSNAFSEKALRDQEPLIQRHVGLLMRRLHEKTENGEPLDIVRYYNFATFDIVGDLIFGEGFGCLENDDYHSYVATVLGNLKAVAIRTALRYYYLVEKFYMMFMPKDTINKTVEHFNNARAKVTKRLNTETDRPDFITLVQKQPESKAVTRDELDANAGVFLTAGSETTATTLSGTTYLLLNNPEKMKKVVKEVRETFRSSNDITIEAVQHLPYLLAVLTEGMRCYPPVATGFPRSVPEGGGQVSGYFVPGHTTIYVSQYPTYHSKRNFVEPNSFIPERWLDDADEKFKNDKKSVMMPFSNGPRNCIGKNLAYAEMRVILARILFEFDIEMVDPDFDWMKQKLYLLWEKPALNVRLTPVEHA
ncbi:isotrichodermin C-15 hydroxylase [Phyllosticta citriasiana]|uniref:Isotrichodermin C-15 hydroxylase n=1 Tax=Phyllosticta citriasiana TaxID=595635 RepID=A0ABR1KJC9_9PEZI